MVQAGNSGGSLLDGSGNVVGMVSAKLDAIKIMLASCQPRRLHHRHPGAAPFPLADIANQAQTMSAFMACR